MHVHRILVRTVEFVNLVTVASTMYVTAEATTLASTVKYVRKILSLNQDSMVPRILYVFTENVWIASLNIFYFFFHNL